MSLASLAVEAPGRAGDGTAPRFRPKVVDVVSVLAAAAPFLVVGVLYGVSGHLVLGGDQALIGLDALDARHFEQFVGPYSRMGWAHPGPAWAYLLAPLFWLFGSGGPALVAASMVIDGVVAALVVVAAGTGRPWQRPLMAGLLLLYVLRMPSIDFVAVWNPFALLLPTMLLLLLAARACAGSVTAFASSLVVLSFLLQTHVGTAPLVALVGIVSLAALGMALRRHPELRPDRRVWWRAGVALAVTVLMWVPPVWQQLTARPHQGNLRMLAGYVVHGSAVGDQSKHSWREAVSAIGQMLGAPVYGWPANPALLKTTILTPAVLAGVAVQILGGVVVALLGRRLADRRTSWLGVMTVLGTVAALAAAKTVTGPLMNYLLLWATVLPAVLLFAGISLLVEWWRSVPDRLMSGLAAVVCAFVLAGAAGVGLSLHRSSVTQLGSEPGAHEAADLALAALPAPRSGRNDTVLLDIRDVSVWTTATEVALELEEAGYHVDVSRKWEYGFGWDRLTTGTERWRLAMAPVKPGQTPPAGLLGTVGGLYGPETIALEPAGR